MYVCPSFLTCHSLLPGWGPVPLYSAYLPPSSGWHCGIELLAASAPELPPSEYPPRPLLSLPMAPRGLGAMLRVALTLPWKFCPAHRQPMAVLRTWPSFSATGSWTPWYLFGLGP